MPWRAIILLFLLTGCGKVGEPKPPFIRIPERIRDLAATQSGYDVVLSWTNPAHNLDGSSATDLATVHITSNGVTVADIPTTGTGEPQSYSLPAQAWLGQSRTFNVWVETVRHQTSEVSTVRAQPVDIPGAATNAKAAVDQYAIQITWDAPQRNGDLVGGYFVQRTDRETPPVLATETQFTDRSFNYGKKYTYQIVAARQVDTKWINGIPTPAVSVEANDRTPPRVPTGLAIVVTDSGAIVTWDANQELDLKGYFIFRNGQKLNSKAPQTGNSLVDPDYKPNTTYSVSAIDEFGNESRPSAPIS